MIIGFLGKGGNGKSTMATRLVQSLVREGNNILAVDADHNMDLTYNLEAPEDMTYVGTSWDDMKAHCAIEANNYRLAFSKEPLPQFSFSSPDPFTSKYSHELSPSLRIMTAGPHTDQMIYDKSCSHGLFTSLKIYLPLVSLKDNEYVVVDEKAGTDSVGTGITTGFSLAYVVCEPTLHGLKAGNQIGEMLEFYGTPYEFILNKVTSDEDIELAKTTLRKEPAFVFRFSPELLKPNTPLPKEHEEIFAQIVESLKKHQNEHPDSRIERTQEKIRRRDELAD